MKLVLKEFQELALQRLRTELSLARHEVEVAGKAQALALSSPTGSGKTVIMTAVIENLIEGDGEHPPDPNASFLWITDQPELNEQTRNKMTDHSSTLWMGGLEIISTSFDQQTFDPGKVYFLNTQKLGKDKALISHGDSRTVTIWETISNTVAERAASFYVIIDEAHRGMKETAASRKQATTIIQKFIKGSEGEIPPVPLVIGVSATPERFQALIAGTGRTSRPVDIPPEEVRDSGLLKETIKLWHPTDDQPGDMTMLHAAAAEWKRYRERWETYCNEEGEPAVRPILVIQVEDGTKKTLSSTDIASVIDAISAAVGPLDARAFAHAFEEHTTLEVGDYDLRYLPPASIDIDPDVRVVFFKTSLNTGWDCPRAEVMMSFRKAKDATLIAQLVGRMVRTPLARGVGTDGLLNTVGLYLPHYDDKGLDKVIEYLTAADSGVPPVDVEKGAALVDVERDAGCAACFEAIEEIPSYVIPKATKTTEVRRLMKLARQLSNSGIDAAAPEKAKELLVDLLLDHLKAAELTPAFEKAKKDVEKLDVRARIHRLEEREAEEEEAQLDVTPENIKDLFEAVGRRVGEGLHKEFFAARCATGVSPLTARVELVSLFRVDEGARKALDVLAITTVKERFDDHRSAIKGLDEADRQAFERILGMATKKEQRTLDNLPLRDTVRLEETTWSKHLYVDSAGVFPVRLNTWEKQVIDEELSRDEVVGWLRNPPRKDWSFCVPYEKGGLPAPLYPDFLVFRKEGGGIVVDILDPHAESLADAPAKAKGLAQFADLHRIDFGRIELISVRDGKARRLNLADEDVRAKVRDVTTPTQLEALFGAA